MSAFVTSTRDVAFLVGGFALKTAFWPVFVPLHLAHATKDFVGWTCQQALAPVCQLIQGPNSSDGRGGSNNEDSDQPVVPAASNPVEGLLQLIPIVLGTAGRIKDEIGSTVTSLVTPPTPRQAQANKDGASDDKAVLDRLRLPVIPEHGDPEEPLPLHLQQPEKPQRATTATPADFTKYLLRVEDLGIVAPNTNNAAQKTRVLYIDLSKEYGDQGLLKRCLNKLATRGIELATSHAPNINSPPSKNANSFGDVKWKCEGTTAKILRKRPRQTLQRWEEIMRSDILIWSGTFKNKDGGGSDIHCGYPIFLAQGIVANLSPRAFLELFWDSSRTHEYNFYCTGRDDVLMVDENADELLLSKDIHAATKVVKSETRVPFTGLTVPLLVMMHVRPLPGGPEEGYLIISRSLSSGMAGYHTASSSRSNIQNTKTEILWGVNVLKTVPGHPDQTELHSLSQMASALVPNFLSQKIGLMGVEEFFWNVRNPNSKQAQVATASTSTTSCTGKAVGL
jgi:hypothetical protein